MSYPNPKTLTYQTAYLSNAVSNNVPNATRVIKATRFLLEK